MNRFLKCGIITATITALAGVVFYACNKDNDVVNQKEVNEPRLIGQTQGEYYVLRICYTDKGKNGTECLKVDKKPASECSSPHACRVLPDPDDQPKKVSMQMEVIMADYGELKLYKEFIKEFWETFDYLYKIKELIDSPEVLYEKAPTKEEFYKMEGERKKEEESKKEEKFNKK